MDIETRQKVLESEVKVLRDTIWVLTTRIYNLENFIHEKFRTTIEDPNSIIRNAIQSTGNFSGSRQRPTSNSTVTRLEQDSQTENLQFGFGDLQEPGGIERRERFPVSNNFYQQLECTTNHEPLPPNVEHLMMRIPATIRRHSSSQAAHSQSYHSTQRLYRADQPYPYHHHHLQQQRSDGLLIRRIPSPIQTQSSPIPPIVSPVLSPVNQKRVGFIGPLEQGRMSVTNLSLEDGAGRSQFEKTRSENYEDTQQSHFTTGRAVILKAKIVYILAL